MINEARALADSLDASLVVVSWRSSGDIATQKWLKLIGLRVDAVFIPKLRTISADMLLYREATYDQIGFKVATIKALRALGEEVVASFDDTVPFARHFEYLGIRMFAR